MFIKKLCILFSVLSFVGYFYYKSRGISLHNKNGKDGMKLLGFAFLFAGMIANC